MLNGFLAITAQQLEGTLNGVENGEIDVAN
jgi:hypothetical protein